MALAAEALCSRYVRKRFGTYEQLFPRRGLAWYLRDFVLKCATTCEVLLDTELPARSVAGIVDTFFVILALNLGVSTHYIMFRSYESCFNSACRTVSGTRSERSTDRVDDNSGKCLRSQLPDVTAYSGTLGDPAGPTIP